MVTQIAQQQIPLSRFLPLSLICFSQLRALLAYNKKSNRNNNIGGTACVCNYTVAKMKHNTHTHTGTQQPYLLLLLLTGQSFIFDKTENVTKPYSFLYSRSAVDLEFSLILMT